jgi:hypothetical protein
MRTDSVRKSEDQAKSVDVVRLDTEWKTTVKTAKELGTGIASVCWIAGTQKVDIWRTPHRRKREVKSFIGADWSTFSSCRVGGLTIRSGLHITVFIRQICYDD